MISILDHWEVRRRLLIAGASEEVWRRFWPFPRAVEELYQTQAAVRRANIQHPTSNAQHPMGGGHPVSTK